MHIDFMHTVDLGITQTFCKHVVWCLFRANVWSFRGTTSEVDQSSLIALRHGLFEWYKIQGDKLDGTPVQDLSLSMLGTREKPELKFKAMETRVFFTLRWRS